MNSKFIYFTCKIIFVVLTLSSCSSVEETPSTKSNEFSATLIAEKELKGFASGSGMEYHRGNLFMCGDDDAFLWIFNQQEELVRSLQLGDTIDRQNGRLNSKTKPDFEALTFFPHQKDTSLLIFGSGSKSPKRDILLQVYPNRLDSVFIHSGERFFHWLKNRVGLTDKTTNLEGAAFWKENVLLVNRATNELYMLPQQGFEQFLQEADTAALSVKSYTVELPQLEQDTARFSGASVLAGTDYLLFSASVEATEDWTNDGGILGSYVGIIDLSTFEKTSSTLYVAPVLTSDSTMYLGKIEGLHGFKITPNSIEVKAITDNDDGTTQLLTIQLNIH